MRSVLLCGLSSLRAQGFCYFERSFLRIKERDVRERLRQCPLHVGLHFAGEPLVPLEDRTFRVEGAEDLRIGFKRETWEVPLSDGTTGKVMVSVVLPKLVNVDLLTLLRYICDANRMTFSIKKNEVLFRPLIG